MGGYSPHVAKLLAARGIETTSDAEHFLDPGLHRLSDPFLIHQMDVAVRRTADAIRRGERICIYGDYDVDGQASAALLARVIREFGGEATVYIPNRMEEGYGLNERALLRVQQDGATLVLTVDCGVTAIEEAAWAKEHGLDLVITDHHQPGEELPEAVAVVNPKLGAPEALRDLAGAGVALKFAEALGEAMGKGRSAAQAYVELAAVGTVADVVPLRGENRSIVRAGLDRLNCDSQVPGIVALKDVAGIQGDVTVGHVAFALGPRLNAAGRIADATAGVELLTADAYDKALPIAEQLDRENEERRRIERRIDEEADRFIRERRDVTRDRALVAWGERWHPGVIGIVASRVVERYHRPTVILSIEDELARGSARSIPGLNLFEALSDCRELFEAFGGHEGAAGLTIKKANLEAFCEMFHAAVAKRVDDRMLIPSLEYDGVIELGELSLKLVEDIARLAPFGVGNPSPVLVARGVGLRTRPVGKDGSHLKFSISSADGAYSLDGIGFGLAEPVGSKLKPEALYDIAFVPEINEWNGRRSPSLQVKDVRKSAADRIPEAAPVAAARENALVSDPAVGEAAAPEYGSVDGIIRWRLDSGPPREWRIVDRRSEGAARAIEDLARAGLPSYVIPGPGGRRVVEAIAALGYRERTADLGAMSRGESPESSEGALRQQGWIAVASGPPGPGAIERLRRSLSGFNASVGAVLWGIPADVREIVVHVEALRRLGAKIEFYLAFRPQDEAERREDLLRRFPDRDRLGRLYVSIKNELGAKGTFTLQRAFGAVDRKWPGALTPEGVHRAMDVFVELGLVKAAPGGYMLAPEPARKVDLVGSLRYNEFTRIRERLIRSQRELEGASPDHFFSRLWELSRKVGDVLSIDRLTGM